MSQESTYQYTTPRHKILYDKEKCGNAYLCLKCVEATNNNGCLCLGWMNTETPEPGVPKKWEDIDWKIVPAFMPMCDACGKCIKACPVDALKLELAPPRIPASRVQRSDIVYCYTLKDGTKISARDQK